MKTTSNEPIIPIQSLGGNSYYIHKNIVAKKDESDNDVYEADTVRVDNVTLEEVAEIAGKISTI